MISEVLLQIFQYYGSLDTGIVCYLVTLFILGFMRSMKISLQLKPNQAKTFKHSHVSNNVLHYIPVVNTLVLSIVSFVLVSAYIIGWVADAIQILTSSGKVGTTSDKAGKNKPNEDD